MNTQISMRLQSDLVAWIDEQVEDRGGSRSAVSARAFWRYRWQLAAEHDARIYREFGDYPGFAGMHEWHDYPELD